VHHEFAIMLSNFHLFSPPVAAVNNIIIPKIPSCLKRVVTLAYFVKYMMTLYDLQ